MKNHCNDKLLFWMAQYHNEGILRIVILTPQKEKFCQLKKAPNFAVQAERMINNLHIHHHHLTQPVGCDVIM